MVGLMAAHLPWFIWFTMYPMAARPGPADQVAYHAMDRSPESLEQFSSMIGTVAAGARARQFRALDGGVGRFGDAS